MVRYFTERLRIPPAKCPNPACGKYCWFPTAQEALCFFCKQAHFVHREEWEWADCACKGDDPYCKECWGSGIVGSMKHCTNTAQNVSESKPENR